MQSSERLLHWIWSSCWTAPAPWEATSLQPKMISSPSWKISSALSPIFLCVLPLLGIETPKRLAVFEFSTDVDAFKAFVGDQVASGGGDAPEDVFGALNVACNLSWNSALRMLYHIADAPCHGEDYHDKSMGDSHSAGDPLGLRAEDLISNLKGKNIEYFFGRINNSTDLMINKFNSIAGGDKYITTTPMSEGTMMTTILASVSLSLTSSLTSSVRTEGGGMVMKEVVLVSVGIATDRECSAIQPQTPNFHF